MKTIKNIPLLLLLLVSFTFAPGVSHGAEIRLSVAASMTDAIRELAAAYTDKNQGITILPNMGSSGSLAKQITHGAPADIFISANRKWMDHLIAAGKIDRPSVQLFAANSLVFIGTPKTHVTALAGVASLDRIAIGSPKSVPVGQYAEQTMRGAGLYEQMLAANKLVMAKDARQALLYADRGEVAGAFVYKTDALLARRAAILFSVPANLHDPIAYPMGLTKDGSNNSAAKSFYSYLASPEAMTIMEKFGFSAPATIAR